jgi:protein transport protein SEC24
MSTPKSIRESIITQAANILASYRKNYAQETTIGQLVLPETLKLLPIYVASLIKSDVLTGSTLNIWIDLFGSIFYLAYTLTTDDRSWLIHRLMSMNVKGTSVYLYPRIYPLVCRLFVREDFELLI